MLPLSPLRPANQFFIDEHKVAEGCLCLLDVLSAYLRPTTFTFLFRAALETKNRWLPVRFQSEIRVFESEFCCAQRRTASRGACRWCCEYDGRGLSVTSDGKPKHVDKIDVMCSDDADTSLRVTLSSEDKAERILVSPLTKRKMTLPAQWLSAARACSAWA